MNITKKLNALVAAKSALKDAINQKGGSLTNEKLSEYAAAVLAIEVGKTYDFETYVGGGFFVVCDDSNPEAVVEPSGMLEYYNDGGTLEFTALKSGVCTVKVQEGYLGEGEYEKVTEYCVLIISQSGTDTTDADATESDIIAGKSAYVGGKKVHGTMSLYAGETI